MHVEQMTTICNPTTTALGKEMLATRTVPLHTGETATIVKEEKVYNGVYHAHSTTYGRKLFKDVFLYSL